MTSPSSNWIIYDGDCPFCRNYMRLTNLKKSIGPVRLINARDGGPEVDKAKAAGLDLDEGMVMQYNGQLYHGDQCLNMMAMMSGDSGLFNRAAALVFKSPKVAKVAYPWLRCGRALTLHLLGRKKISGDKF